VNKKSLCTWWFQYRMLQVLFKVSPASLQTFIDTPNCVLEDRIQYSTVHIPNVFCDGHLQLINCVGMKSSGAQRLFDHHVYITRLESNEIFSPSNKIHRKAGRAKDLSALLYVSPGSFYYTIAGSILENPWYTLRFKGGNWKQKKSWAVLHLFSHLISTFLHRWHQKRALNASTSTESYYPLNRGKWQFFCRYNN
jgi:hypothetical protein